MAKLANAFIEESTRESAPPLWSTINKVQARDCTHKTSRLNCPPRINLAEQPDASNFSIREQIGIGSGGTTVHRCCDERTGIDFALKIVPRPDYEPSPTEAMLMDQWSSVNSILPTHVVSKDSKTYISMELGCGGDLLEHVLKEGPMEEMAVAQIAKKLAEALKDLHSVMRVCHRDIKPENVCIMSRDDPTDVRLCDFGLARPLLEEGHIYTQEESAGSSTGSLDYMAPERFYGIAAGAAGDCWGLGVLVYSLLMGSLPFECPSEPLDRRHPRLRPGAYQHLSAEATDLISGLLQHDPKARSGIDDVLGHPWLEKNQKKLDIQQKVKRAHKQALELSRLANLQQEPFSCHKQQQECKA